MARLIARALPARVSRRVFALVALGLFGLNVTYNLVRNAPIEMEMGLPDCSKLARGKTGKVTLDRWHIYPDPSSSTYLLTGCISNHTANAIDDSKLSGQLSYAYFADDTSFLDTLLSIQDGTYDIAFDTVPPSSSRPFLVRRPIEAETMRDMEGIELGIYQIQWTDDTTTQARELYLPVSLASFTPPVVSNPCEGMLGMTGNVEVGNLSIQRDAFGLLNVEGCLRNGTNTTAGSLILNYIDAKDSSKADVTAKTMPLTLVGTLESGDSIYIREPVSASETDIILRSIAWEDRDELEDRTAIVTQSIQLQN
ncbi:MAG: hypothetical protein AAFY15_12620 [Cyanobacteria bacterium J06648_11]